MDAARPIPEPGADRTSENKYQHVMHEARAKKRTREDYYEDRRHLHRPPPVATDD